MSEQTVVPPHVIMQRYITGKDGNRPAGFERTFAIDATVQIDADTDGVSFPPLINGRSAIAHHLASDFNRRYENVYTFCLCKAPDPTLERFSCPWVVVMSVKEDHSIRVGWGQYHWVFDATDNGLCRELQIQISDMLSLPSTLSSAVNTWVQDLPYPWIDARDLAARVPVDDHLAPINGWLANRSWCTDSYKAVG